jgi:hypothetical protein
MTTKFSARVLETRAGGEIAVSYFVRAVPSNVKLLDDGASETDGWAAYREEPVFVTVGTERQQYLVVERVSDAPRATVEDAAADMWAAIQVHTDPDSAVPARLIRSGSPYRQRS